MMILLYNKSKSQKMIDFQLLFQRHMKNRSKEQQLQHQICRQIKAVSKTSSTLMINT
jgi:hypothetical protein